MNLWWIRSRFKSLLKAIKNRKGKCFCKHFPFLVIRATVAVLKPQFTVHKVIPCLPLTWALKSHIIYKVIANPVPSFFHYLCLYRQSKRNKLIGFIPCCMDIRLVSVSSYRSTFLRKFPGLDTNFLKPLLFTKNFFQSSGFLQPTLLSLNC